MKLTLQQVVSGFTGVFRDRYSDLGTFPVLPQYPEFDGDMAELDQLAQQVLDAGIGDPEDGYEAWFRRYTLLRAAADAIASYEVDAWPVYPTFPEMWAAAGRAA